MRAFLSDVVPKPAAFALVFVFSLQFQNCRDQGTDPVTVVVSESSDVALRSVDTFRFPTVGGDEEGARIIVQAEHYNVSEIRRNAETSWIAVYVYQPKAGYTGPDYAVIEIQSGSNGASPPTNIRTVAFRFVISN